MNGFSDDFSKQTDALKMVYKHVLSKISLHAWSFGGGTALSLFYFQHRKSYDIDIFINNLGSFATLSPKQFINESPAFEPDYKELVHHISLTTVTGIKTDLLLASRLTPHRPVLKKISDTDCYVDTVYEIIAKKLKYRMNEMRARDIFDIAVAIHKEPAILKCLWDDRVITTDEFFEWQYKLKNLDKQLYAEHINLTAPYPGYRDLASDAPQVIIQNIEWVKTEIQKELSFEGFV